MFLDNVLVFTCVICLGVLSTADEAVTSGSDSGADTSSYIRYLRAAKVAPDFKPYGFRQRSIPLRRSDKREKPVYYAKDNLDNGYKTEILFPGNYYSISKEKSNKKIENEQNYSQQNGYFTPQVIPLIRGQTFERRSLDDSEEPTLEKPEETSEISLMKRSISYILGSEDDEDNEDDEEELETGEEAGVMEGDRGSHIKKKIRKKAKKYSKYMMPLLLAYKLKYFALVPVLISGLVLLVGVTGMAGFFFALFAAVMGLQKGGY